MIIVMGHLNNKDNIKRYSKVFSNKEFTDKFQILLEDIKKITSRVNIENDQLGRPKKVVCISDQNGTIGQLDIIYR